MSNGDLASQASAQRDLRSKLEWVEIPAGHFKMGLTRLQALSLYGSMTWGDETPQRKVYLPTFYISRFPITCGQFTEFVRIVHPDWDIRPSDHTHFAMHPTFISYRTAEEFCNWLGVRLPTSEEWEKAARGKHGRLFPWGNKLDVRRANLGQKDRRGLTSRSTSPVDAYPEGASPYGVMDMVGNCYEWTSTSKRIGKDEMKVIRSSDPDSDAMTPRAHCVTALMIGGLNRMSYPPNTGFRVAADKLPEA